jgi:hypothetical protein
MLNKTSVPYQTDVILGCVKAQVHELLMYNMSGIWLQENRPNKFTYMVWTGGISELRKIAALPMGG